MNFYAKFIQSFYPVENIYHSSIISRVGHIKANDISHIEIPVTISLSKVEKTLFDIIKKGDKIPYKLHMDLIVDSPDKMIKNSHIKIVSEGPVKSLLQAAKGAKKALKN